MPRKQEQEDARAEITEVAPNAVRMELPIHMPGLGHVNCYALIDRDGAAVVDPGLPGPASWRALQHRLKQAGLAVKDVHTVVITHSHPDHFGGAARFARESGAKVVAHKSFGYASWMQAETPEVSAEDLAAEDGARDESEAGEGDAGGEPKASPRRMPHGPSMYGSRTPWGSRPPQPPLRYRIRRRMQRVMRRGVDMMLPAVTDPVEHGDVLTLAGREWFALHTPGHTMDHICLHDPDSGIFLAGDHVLPQITPHISGHLHGRDPLKLFFYALDRVGEITGVKRVLPAHGHPFQDLHGRAEAIKRHHRERLERLKEISRELGRAGTVPEYTQRLFARRSWGPMAESETYAHLEHLRLMHEAECVTDESGSPRYLLH